jgi:hypothetical protein
LENKEISGQDFDFADFFKTERLFKRKYKGGYIPGFGGSILDGGRTILGHGENGTVIDEGETTNKDFQS